MKMVRAERNPTFFKSIKINYEPLLSTSRNTSLISAMHPLRHSYSAPILNTPNSERLARPGGYEGNYFTEKGGTKCTYGIAYWNPSRAS